ncbi:hypothetical protein GCM10009741_31320 [Kribbella lupini]|uniref:Winged helix-turn helix protein n=1 Tax=Kribbella lupini TaxID=291602 RepID=A0ABN2ATZ3_9ACTN
MGWCGGESATAVELVRATGLGGDARQDRAGARTRRKMLWSWCARLVRVGAPGGPIGRQTVWGLVGRAGADCRRVERVGGERAGAPGAGPATPGGLALGRKYPQSWLDELGE